MSELHLIVTDASRDRLRRAIERVPTGYVVDMTPPKRSNVQNATMWMMIDPIAKHVGMGDEECKHELAGRLLPTFLPPERLAKVHTPSRLGVMLGQPYQTQEHWHTSRLRKSEMSEFWNLIYSTGCEMGLRMPHPDDQHRAVAA